MLPPTADIGATWSTPFMDNGAQIFHSHGGGFLRGDGALDGWGGGPQQSTTKHTPTMMCGRHVMHSIDGL